MMGYETKIAAQLHGWSHDFGIGSINSMLFLYLGLGFGWISGMMSRWKIYRGSDSEIVMGI